MKKALIATFLASILLTGCGDRFDLQRKQLAWFVGLGKTGDSTDYWLVKRTFGIDDQIALVFGYANDLEACQDISDVLNQKYPEASYACSAAN